MEKKKRKIIFEILFYSNAFVRNILRDRLGSTEVPTNFYVSIMSIRPIDDVKEND